MPNIQSHAILKGLTKCPIQKIFRAIIILAIPLVLAGCVGFGISDSSAPAKGEFLKGAVARGFPSVPAYPGVRLGESYGDSRNWGVYSVSSDNLNDVLKFYSENLGKVGWENSLKQLSQNRYIYEIKNAKYQGNIIVNTAADMRSTAITVSLIARTP